MEPNKAKITLYAAIEISACQITRQKNYIKMLGGEDAATWIPNSVSIDT